MKINKPHPLMYDGYIIRTCKSTGKLSAFSFRTNISLNPIYDSCEALKSVIDALDDKPVRV